MKNLALIPARSQSKGLKDKNIRIMNGMPLLAYSIRSAQESGCFQEIHVSTDSQLYSEIAKKFGASVPFLRSREAATGTASSKQVINEVLFKYQEMGQTFDTMMLLQPTSPLRTAEDIRQAYQILWENDADSVVGVCEMDHSPQWCNTLPEDGRMAHFIKPEILNTPRQELKTYYRVNGACYLCKVQAFQKAGTWYGEKSYAYVMPRRRSIDIDDELDFQIAEVVMRHGIPQDGL